MKIETKISQLESRIVIANVALHTLLSAYIFSIRNDSGIPVNSKCLRLGDALCGNGITMTDRNRNVKQ